MNHLSVITDPTDPIDVLERRIDFLREKLNAIRPSLPEEIRAHTENRLLSELRDVITGEHAQYSAETKRVAGAALYILLEIRVDKNLMSGKPLRDSLRGMFKRRVNWLQTRIGQRQLQGKQSPRDTNELLALTKLEAQNWNNRIDVPDMLAEYDPLFFQK